MISQSEEIITVGHQPFSGQDFHMTDQRPLYSEGHWPTTPFPHTLSYTFSCNEIH